MHLCSFSLAYNSSPELCDFKVLFHSYASRTSTTWSIPMQSPAHYWSTEAKIKAISYAMLSC